MSAPSMDAYRKRITYKVNRWGGDSSDPAFPEDRERADWGVADVVSSEAADLWPCVEGGWHRPVLDLDFPHHYEPSSTPGHGHLYLDTPVEWRRYRKLLDAMEECGILEPGYVAASKARKATFVRLPWRKK